MGGLGYNPNLGNQRIASVIGARFGLDEDAAGHLFDAWQHASMTYPLTTGFHWGALDFQWYIEGCQSRAGPAENDTGYHDVNRFITLSPHAESGCLSISEYVEQTASGGASSKTTPLERANELDEHAEAALAGADGISVNDNESLRRTLADVKTMAYLGQFYADKIRGATELALYRATGNAAQQKAAIDCLVGAAQHWADYCELALAYHKNPLWTNRVGDVDWLKNYQLALEDIRIAGGDPEELGLPGKLDLDAEPIERPWRK